MSEKNKQTVEFIKLLQQLDKQSQAGLLLMIQGARLINDGEIKKQRVNRRSHS